MRLLKDEWARFKVDRPTNVGLIAIKKNVKVKSGLIDLIFGRKSLLISLHGSATSAFRSVTNLKLLRSNDRDWETVGNGWTQKKEFKVNDLLSSKLTHELAVILDRHTQGNKRYFHVEALTYQPSP